MAHLLDKIKDRLGIEEDSEEYPDRFDDMNYMVGNTSGLDVGQIPTAMDKRIGSESQIGGSLMEVQIYNPATFSIEREAMVNTIEQLGIDITLHSDPNVGFTSAYKAQARQGSGFETVQRYFTEYLSALAEFKKFVTERKETDFKVGRINPHISTSGLPSIEQRVPDDVGVDPFGFHFTDLEQQSYDNRNKRDRNIFENKEFMKKFYRTFVVNELGNNEYRYFDRLYQPFSTNFDISWREAQNDIVNKIWKDRTGKNGNSKTEDKVKIISTAGRQTPGITPDWLDILKDKEFEDGESIEVPEPGPEDERTISGLEELDTYLKAISAQRYSLSGMRNLSEIYYFMSKSQLTRMTSGPRNFELAKEKQERLWELTEPLLNDAIDELWDMKDEEDELKVSLIPVTTKVAAISNELQIPDNRILERAFETHKEPLRKEIEKMFTGRPEMFKDHSSDDELSDAEDIALRFLQSFTRNFEQQIWMESNIFYYILPCWMTTSSVNASNHQGWKAPEFIWKAIIERKWSKEYKLDLENPDPEEQKGYFDALEEDKEFRMDVAAASAACYVWGHFTQVEEEFDPKEGLAGGKFTWMEWMNKHGIGVNFEAMDSSPKELLKLWRPKDTVVAARAINITAREELEEIHPELDESIAKFTIDMEHVGAAGVDPWKEMERLIRQEKEMAENQEFRDYGILTDKNKPLAKILRQYHLMKPGLESQRGTRHGPISRGDTEIYRWVYELVKEGFARNEGEPAAMMFEQAEEKSETIYMTRIMMEMIQRGIKPEDLNPEEVPLEGEYENTEQALMARFFGLDKAQYNSEMTKIEEHAFDPLENLLEAEQFDYTHSSSKALEENRPGEWQQEEYR